VVGGHADCLQNPVISGSGCAGRRPRDTDWFVPYESQTSELNAIGIDSALGGLDGDVEIRADPYSTGQTAISPSDGQFAITSFFDIFTDISLDHPPTWRPAQSANVPEKLLAKA
jgi:hypothetical protein